MAAWWSTPPAAAGPRTPGSSVIRRHYPDRPRPERTADVCGLAGEIRFDGRKADVVACDRIAGRLASRGPDGEGAWTRGPVALGHRRLSIIDLSAAGSQPMVDSPLGLTVVFNGCIYNYQDLRAELEAHGHRFFSTSDTEVIGKAYARWGISCVDHFFGMFAFAIVEHETGRVILGRDRLGIKPLYLDQTAERLRFASTLRVLLSGGIDSSLVVALLAEAGQTGLATFSIGFDSAGGESGDEFVYSSLVAERFGTDHHQIRIDSRRLLPGIDAAVAAMSEPMVSHDCVAFYLLSQDVSANVKVVQSGQGADEVLGGYDWYPPLAGVPRDQAVEAYAGVFFDRRWPAMRSLLQPDWLLGHDAPTSYITERFGQPGAETAVDAALRNDTLVMLVDDPVKRVDNMTMAWGLEARVPFLDHEVVELAGRIPPELKLADGGKGVLKRASRGVVPDEVIDRTKGYFPVPAIRQLEGPYLERVRDALTDPAAKRRGLFRPDVVERMLREPNVTRTTLGSNALWQLALLEMWLQEVEDRSR